ncbi:hypothetical protein ABZ540_00450 [Nocardia xishanensis]|uniref:hypothetical protein n=1 Tax=Nocardia xishanensis TaxID=238964 RepID=UPI003404A8A4
MLRRFAAAFAAVIVVLGVAACQDELPTMPAGPAISWSTAPASDEEYLAVMAAVRAIDPCAIIPRQELTAIGTVVKVEARSTYTCEATLGSAEFGKSTIVRWSLGVSRDPVEGSDTMEPPARIGDATMVVDREADAAEQGSMTRTCTALGQFPSTVLLDVNVVTPTDQLPCALAKKVMSNALDVLRTAPAAGTSPDTPKTVLSGADPCAVLDSLGTTTPASEHYLFGCVFQYKGSDIDLQYAYEGELIATGGTPVLEVNGHRGYDRRSTTETYWYSVVVGPAFGTADPKTTMGRQLPVARLMGRDPEVLREVLQHVAELFPAG